MNRFLTILLSILTWSLFAQSPYRLSVNTDVPIGLSAVSMFTASALLGSTKRLPPQQEILQLQRSEINRFDRGATFQYSPTISRISDATILLATALPLIHLATKNSRKDFGKVALMGAEVFMLNLAFTNLVKESVSRKRPLLYNEKVPIERKMKKDYFKSFFSGHTSTTSAMSLYFAQTYAHYHPNSKWRPMVWSLSAAFPLVTGILRYKAGKHYWTDILVGYAAGALVGIGVPYLHRATGLQK